jgi:hypothetical protein
MQRNARSRLIRFLFLIRVVVISEPAKGADAAAEHSHHDRTGHANALHSAPAVIHQAEKNERAGEGEPAEQDGAAENAREQTCPETRLGATCGRQVRIIVGIVRRRICRIVHRFSLA